MTSNPAKASADEAMSAEEILGLARGGVSSDLLGCLIGSDCTALVRYAWRRVTVAFRRGSLPLLRDALLAFGICQAARDDGMDDRAASAPPLLCQGSSDFMAMDWFAIADKPVEVMRKELAMPPKSPLALRAGSVGPWETAGISPFQLNAGRALAEAEGREYRAPGS